MSPFLDGAGDAEYGRIRAIVADAWQTVLPDVPLHPDLRWSDAGADSLKSLHLVLHLEEALDRRVPFDLLSREMTVDDLTRLLAYGAGEVASPLPPIFLVPGVFGDGPILAQFRRAFQGEIKFELVELPDLDDPMRIHRDMAATGRFVAEEILRRAGDGDIALAGFSFGGTVAFEAAHHLIARGRRVSLLVLLDSFADGAPTNTAVALRPEPAPVAAAPSRRGARVRRFVRRAMPRADEGWRRYGDRLVFVALVLSGLGDVARRRLRATRRRLDTATLIGRRKILLGLARRRAIRHWRPQRLDVPTLLAVSDEGAAAGTPRRWTIHCPALEVRRVPGDHLSLFEPPSLAILVPSIMEAVRSVDGRGSRSGE